MNNYSLFLSALGRARRTKDDVSILDNNLNIVTSAVVTLQIDVNNGFNSVSSAISTLQLQVDSVSSAISTLQINDEAIRQAAGLTINFGYPVFSGTNSLDDTTSITDALLALDNSIHPISVDGGFASMADDRIQLRRDIASNWTSANPVLSQGEIGLELDTGLMKIGDGVSDWVSLSYSSIQAEKVYYSGTVPEENVSDALDALKLMLDGKLGLLAKAADSDKLDGYDSTYFAPVSHNHDSAYLGKTATAADSAKLGGKSLGTGANNVLSADSSGNVGIGGNSKGARLHVENPNTPYVSFDDGTRFLNIGVDTASGKVFYNTNTYHSFLTQSGALEAMKIATDGSLLAGVSSGTYHIFSKALAEGDNPILLIKSSTTGGVSAYFAAVASAGWNSATAAMNVGKNNTTGRSINAGGTVNASGADYAEYMRKSCDCGDISKGDICGINSEGKLTDKWSDSIHFAVKSTNPCLVGGDVWGTEDVVGIKPVLEPRRSDETERIVKEPALYDGEEMIRAAVYEDIVVEQGETDEEFAERMSAYEAELAVWSDKLEAERQKVDRIAFSGQVPVNVTEFEIGDYILPVETADGGICGVAVSDDDIAFSQYKKAIGRVIAREEDGRARIIVKVI
jgi:hypothetical protein